MNRLDSLRMETMQELQSELKLCEKDLVTLSRERDGLRADIDLPAHFLITATGMVNRLHKEISRIRRVINEKKPLAAEIADQGRLAKLRARRVRREKAQTRHIEAHGQLCSGQ